MTKIVRYGLVFIGLTFVAVASAGLPLDLTPLPPIEQNVGDESRVQSFALADLDADSVLDLVVIDTETEEIWAYLGEGDGTFAEGLLVGFADLPSAVAVADLTSPFESGGDVDGIPDVIVVDELGGLQIFIGRGDGTFDPPDQTFDDLDTVELVGIAVADFDGDGRDDLALLESFDGVYFLCNSAGTMVPCPTPVVFLDDFLPELVDIAVGDFNGGGLDVAVIDRDTAGLYVIFGNGDGTFDEFVEPIEIGLPGVEPQAVRVLPVAQEGDVDGIVVLAVDFLLEEIAASVSVLSAATGSREFAQTDYAAGAIGNALVVDDLDGDGQLDLLVVGEDSLEQLAAVTFLRGTAAGFLPAVSVASEAFAGGRAVASGDLDDNGKPDLVAVIDDGERVLVLLNDSEPRPVCVGDCDGNGSVAINELIRGVNIALGLADVATCIAMDRDGNGAVAIAELIAAVNNALHGCGS